MTHLGTADALTLLCAEQAQDADEVHQLRFDIVEAPIEVPSDVTADGRPKARC